MTPRTPTAPVDRHAADLGAAVADRRKAKGMTQTALAEAAKIDRGTLRSIEQGKRTPTAATLRVIAKALGTTPAALNPNPAAAVAAEAAPIMTTEQVSELLQVAVGTLKQWRSTGAGPRWFKLGTGLVRYRRADVIAWVDAQYSASAS